MSFNPGINVGDILTNNEVVDVFGVGNMGGMRRSKKNNILVIVCDHTKGLYDDKWYGDELYYTGMGKAGDQDFVAQNKTLAESPKNGVEVHLLEVFIRGQYIYRGVVVLAGKPYREDQEDDNGNSRKVLMFPVKLKSDDSGISAEEFETYTREQESKTKDLPNSELRKRAEQGGSTKVSHRKVTTDEKVRNPYVAEYVKRLAKGRCQLCGQMAPFWDKDHTPYLESHHVIWLSRGGSDTINNCVALCPNCHRKMHIVDDPEDLRKLQEIAYGY